MAADASRFCAELGESGVLRGQSGVLSQTAGGDVECDRHRTQRRLDGAAPEAYQVRLFIHRGRRHNVSLPVEAPGVEAPVETGLPTVSAGLEGNVEAVEGAVLTADSAVTASDQVGPLPVHAGDDAPLPVHYRHPIFKPYVRLDAPEVRYVASGHHRVRRPRLLSQVSRLQRRVVAQQRAQGGAGDEGARRLGPTHVDKEGYADLVIGIGAY